MNSIVAWIHSMSPNSFSVLIPCAPTFLLNLSLSLSYRPHFSRKCATVSAASLHSHVGSSMILNRARYLFSEQCPVLRREIHAMCFRFPISWYSFAPCLTFGLLLIFRSWWASSFPCCQDFCHSDLMSFWITVQRADFRCFEPCVAWSRMPLVWLLCRLSHFPLYLGALGSIRC